MNQLHPLKRAKQQHKFCKDGNDEKEIQRQNVKTFLKIAQNSQKRPALNSKHSKLMMP